MELSYNKWKVMKVWGKVKAVQYASELTLYFLLVRRRIQLYSFLVYSRENETGA